MQLTYVPEMNSANHEEGITDFFERQREHRPTQDPERRLLGKEIQARIATAMESLSPRERVVFGASPGAAAHHHGAEQ